MLATAVTAIVRICTRVPWLIIVLGLAAAGASVVYCAVHFAINTDYNKLISPELDWRQREVEFEKLFPGHFGSTLVVVDAPTAELASRASADLTRRLAAQPQLFRSVEDMAGNEFFSRNGLLFRPTDDVLRLTQGLRQAGPLIGTLVADQSLRGLTRALSLVFIGVQNHSTTLDALAPTLSMAATTFEDVLAGRPAAFSWQELLVGHPPAASDLRRLIEVHPVLDYSALQPGKPSSDAIRQAAEELDLAGKYRARVRLTGSVPMADEEFATVQQGALVNGLATVVIVLVILWLALKSARIISAVFINLFVGLSITAALGLMMVGALNMISVAFAVLFVGLGVDFAIQFSVRYRAERHDIGELRPALAQAAAKVGVPLTLAAAAVAAGFMSFMPTDYRGVSELGQIAGVGMLVAYATSITLLPALLAVMNPPGEAHPVGYRALAPVDWFLQTYRVPVIVGTVAVALLGSPLLYFLTFDFDPIHLRSSATRIDFDLARSRRRSAGRHQFGQRRAAVARCRQCRRRAACEAAGSLERDDAAKLRAAGSGQEAGRDPGARRQSRPDPAAAGTNQPPSDAENVAALNGIADQLERDRGRCQRARRRCGQAPGRGGAQIGGGDAGASRDGASGLCRAARYRRRRFAQLSAGADGHDRQPAGQPQAPMGRAGRTRARRGRAERQYQRDRGAADIRARGAGRRSGRGRRPDLDPQIRRHRRDGFHRGGRLRADRRSRSSFGSCCAASATCC